MGSTLTVSYSFGDDLFLFHVGDTRAYVFRAGQLQQLTHDHTIGQSLVDAGALESSALKEHKLRHILTRALGHGAHQVQTEVHQLQLVNDDRLLLCSDGLHDMVDDATIARILSQNLSSKDACQALVDKALEVGGRDNVTVLLARYAVPERPKNAPDLTPL